MPPTRHSEAQRAKALDLYARFGAAEAAKTTGIDASTIRQWASRSGLSRDKSKKTSAACEANRVESQNRRLELARRTDEVATSVLEYVQVACDEGDARAAKDYAVVFGVLVDKTSVLTSRGDAVSRDWVDPDAGMTIEELRERAVESLKEARAKRALIKGHQDTKTDAR